MLTDAQRPVFAVVVEVQLGRDPTKRWSWPVYVATLRARLRCPTALLVLSPSAAVAEWCAAPIPLGHPGLALRPLTIGPDRVPVVSDPATASASPELAVLSAMAHGGHPEQERVLNALLTELRTVDGDRANLHADVVLALLTVLATRGIEVPEQARERITACTDLDQLQRWIERAVTISHIDELW